MATAPRRARGRRDGDDLNQLCAGALRRVDEERFTKARLAAAFVEIYQACFDRLAYRASAFRLDGGRDAIDVVQDVFIDFLEVISDTHRREELAATTPFAYLYVLTMRRAIDATRMAKREASRSSDAADDVIAQIADPRAPPDVLATVGRLLEALDPQDADIFIYSNLHGMTSEEIGQRLGLSPANVRKKQERGRKRLRQALAEEAERAAPPSPPRRAKPAGKKP